MFAHDKRLFNGLIVTAIFNARAAFWMHDKRLRTSAHEPLIGNDKRIEYYAQ